MMLFLDLFLFLRRSAIEFMAEVRALKFAVREPKNTHDVRLTVTIGNGTRKAAAAIATREKERKIRHASKGASIEKKQQVLCIKISMLSETAILKGKTLALRNET